MLICVTLNCSENGVKHTVNLEGLTVYCGVCGLELTASE